MVRAFRFLRDFIFDRGSVQVRLARLTAVGVIISVAFIGVISFVVARASMYRHLDRELVSVASYTVKPAASDIETLGGFNASALQASNLTMFFIRTDGVVRRVPGLRSTLEAQADQIAIAKTGEGISIRSIRGTDGGIYRVVAIPFKSESGQFALVIGRPLGATISALSDIGNTILSLSLIFIALAAVMGYIAGRRITRPLRELSSAVSHVIQTDELEPIGVYSDDELGDLSRNFDTMLASLASSRERQQRLIADAGHELRTPLTSMKTNVELLVADQKSGMLPHETRGEILDDIAAQLGEFASLVGDLVQLSRDNKVAIVRELLDLADVVGNAVERAKRRGPGLYFDLSVESCLVCGDAGALERAITNLLDNAVKFSPEYGTIHVNLCEGVLTIWDEGPGIDPDDMPKIFDRFYRSDKARNTPGTGLGLSIVDHTAQAHGGRVSVCNHPGAGAEFIMTIPLAEEPTT